MLSGARGEGVRFAMQMIVRVAEVFSAERLIDVSWSHVASAYNQGPANIDFAKKLVAANTRVAVPTTLTTCSLNLLKDDSASDATARQLIDLYVKMGCDSVMTCAPYLAGREPGFGDHLAWCESSAVVYANSVLGARSNRYVEFVDMCAAVTGRVPYYGLHEYEQRAATVLFRIAGIPDEWLDDDWFYHALGILVGRDCGPHLPALAGLPADCTREQLRSLGSAAASSGSLSMFHAIGITPEAKTREEAFQGAQPLRTLDIGADNICAAACGLGRVDSERLDAVCVGAPHFSYREFETLDKLLHGRRIARSVRFYAATASSVVQQLEDTGMLERLSECGIEFVTGRCTYYRPALPGTEGHVMTNSAKWAYYSPSALGCHVSFASLAECVDSACAGCVVRRDGLWSN